MMRARTRFRSLLAIDNMEGLACVPSDSVGLAYLDPPFNSKRGYDAIIAARAVGESHRRPAFNDSWGWDGDSERALRQLREDVSSDVAGLLRGLVGTLGRSDLAAYLLMMAPRLSEVHRTLAEHGSLYLHCDPGASHYLKIVLDHIFGPENFRNEIIWKRTHAHS